MQTLRPVCIMLFSLKRLFYSLSTAQQLFFFRPARRKDKRECRKDKVNVLHFLGHRGQAVAPIRTECV